MSILPLELHGVEFKADGKRLIKDFNLRIETGPPTFILGPNGAGKSLLLRLCHGLIEPHEGRIVWHGAKDKNPAEAQAMVFQRPILLRRSVADNIDYALKLRNLNAAERKVRMDDVLARTGLNKMRDRFARVLSFGEQQRLALARAWALRPEVLFLDEPTASLDPSSTHSVERIIHAIAEAGTKIIMTTHDLGQARRMAGDVLFLHRGRLKEHAPAETFFTAPQNDLAQAFIKGELLWWNRRNMDFDPGGTHLAQGTADNAPAEGIKRASCQPSDESTQEDK